MIPIAINIDDHTPFIHLFRYHVDPPDTADGRRLRDTVPFAFFDRFCSVCEKYGLSGKISIVPAPACKGDVARGIDGFSKEELAEWKNAATARLGDRFSFGPEMISHYKAYNTSDGSWYDFDEDKWSRMGQTAETLTPYISYALNILRDADIPATGVTSPWMFCETIEDDYRKAIAQSMREVYGSDKAWYFIHTREEWPEKTEPIPGFKLYSVSATIDDSFWATLRTDRTDREFIESIADTYITADGKQGSFIDCINKNIPIVFLAHWQCLFSNGLGTGLSALELIASRVNEHLADKVQWMSFDELIDYTEKRLD